MGETKRRFYLFFQICLIQIFLFNPLTLKGQEEVLFFQRLSVAQNLTSQNNNRFIYRDSEGFVWISSQDGLNRYDGKEIKQYLPIEDDSLSLSNSGIEGMFFEDNKQNLWISTTDYLNYFDRKSEYFIRYDLGNCLEIDTSTAIKRNRVLFQDTLHNRLWVWYKDSIYVYAPDQHKFLYSLDTLGYLQGLGLKMEAAKNDSGHYLFVPHTNGWQIRYYQDSIKIWEKDYPEKKEPKFRAWKFLFEKEGRLWIGTDAGLVVQNINTGRFNLFNNFIDYRVAPVTGLAPFGEDNLIVATNEKGIFYFNTTRLEFTQRIYSDKEDGIEAFEHPIEHIYLDPENNLWIASPGKGVYHTNLKRKKFKSYLKDRSGSPSGVNFVKAISEDSKGNIWCLTRDGIAVMDQSGKPISGFEKYLGDQVPFAGSNPFFIFCDREDRIWVCVHKGLYMLPKAEGEFIEIASPTESSTGRPVFTYVNQLSNGRILISTLKSGVFEAFIDNEKVSLRNIPEIKDVEGAYSMIYETEKKDKVLFCKLWDSVLIFDQDENDNLVQDTTLPLKSMVNAILEDQLGQIIWIATDNGLFRMNLGESPYELKRDTLLPFKILKSLLQDEKRNLWFGTNRGLVQYNPDTVSWKIFQRSDGLQSLEFNFWSAFKMSNGLLAFGGVNGINIFNPNTIEDLKIPAKPTITNILVEDMPWENPNCVLTGATNITQIRKMNLQWWENTLTFTFAALEYSDPSANQFKYQMVGIDETPVNNGTINSVRYPNLKSGVYTFKVFASNSDGVWFEPRNLDITIDPPWWQTWWARTLGVLAILSLIYAYYRFRVAQIRKEAEFRQKEAEYKQLVAETETAVLRLQMNPHFIFNSMNSINSYILQKDMDTASNYLHRFARLMRMILNFAAKPLIAISDEIELLDLYLQTEAMRFEKKFEYSFDLKDDIDPDDFVIPTMILQPFVENAIWHGISNKKDGEGRIKISFWQENESFYCSVEDNGVGRIASREISQKAKTHESKALSITEHRLQLLEKKNGVTASFEIQDLKDANENPIGTKVVLQFPLL